MREVIYKALKQNIYPIVESKTNAEITLALVFEQLFNNVWVGRTPLKENSHLYYKKIFKNFGITFLFFQTFREDKSEYMKILLHN